MRYKNMLVARVSANTQGGRYGMVLVTRDGDAYEISAGQINLRAQGDFFAVPLSGGKPDFKKIGLELLRRLPSSAKDVLYYFADEYNHWIECAVRVTGYPRPNGYGGEIELLCVHCGALISSWALTRDTRSEFNSAVESVRRAATLGDVRLESVYKGTLPGVHVCGVSPAARKKPGREQ